MPISFIIIEKNSSKFGDGEDEEKTVSWALTSYFYFVLSSLLCSLLTVEIKIEAAKNEIKIIKSNFKITRIVFCSIKLLFS